MSTYSIRNVRESREHDDGEMFRDFEYDVYKDGAKINSWYMETMGPVELEDLRKALQSMKKIDLSFHCLDCKVHTGEINEYYTVHDEIWLLANPLDHGMLCVGCLEERIGRVLTPADFPDYPVNHDFGNKSGRLSSRLGART